MWEGYYIAFYSLLFLMCALINDTLFIASVGQYCFGACRRTHIQSGSQYVILSNQQLKYKFYSMFLTMMF